MLVVAMMLMTVPGLGAAGDDCAGIEENGAYVNPEDCVPHDAPASSGEGADAAT